MGTECQIYEMIFAEFLADEKELKVEDLGDDVPCLAYNLDRVFEMGRIHFGCLILYFYPLLLRYSFVHLLLAVCGNCGLI